MAKSYFKQNTNEIIPKEYSNKGFLSGRFEETKYFEKNSRDIEIQFDELNSDKSNGLNEDSASVINFPRLEICVKYSTESDVNTNPIIITPNSINGKIKCSENRFLFGSSEGLKSSLSYCKFADIDYYFNDETMAFIQFEIRYIETNKKFLVCDDKKGTGLFVKITKRFVISREVVISFCSCHMILQLQNTRKNY